jgi:hypothetical protein
MTFRKDFCELILRKYYLAFISHWSANLRKVFVHLLVFRLTSYDRESQKNLVLIEIY